MKKYVITTLLVLLVSYTSTAQRTATKEAANQFNEKTKSGSYKDLYTSFFQLATTNFTGDDKSIAFNATLFELKSKANPDLKKDINYLNETFSRNFQINVKANLDKDFNYNGFTGGFTWAVYNGRDKSIVTFGKEFDSIFSKFNTNLNKAQSNVVKKIVHDTTLTNSQKAAKIKEFDKIVNQFINKKEIESTDSALVNDFTAELNATSPEVVTELHQFMDAFYQEIDNKALVTIAVDGSNTKEGKFNKASFGFNFLKGVLKDNNNEIDFKAKLVYTDTLQTTHFPRTNLNIKGGWNFKISKNASQESYFEIKAVAEYNKIFNNVLLDEKSELFSANAEIRFRIATDLWIPLIIKYDVEKSNFLGFLNVTYNFGG